MDSQIANYICYYLTFIQLIQSFRCINLISGLKRFHESDKRSTYLMTSRILLLISHLQAFISYFLHLFLLKLICISVFYKKKNNGINLFHYWQSITHYWLHPFIQINISRVKNNLDGV